MGSKQPIAESIPLLPASFARRHPAHLESSLKM
jgi:hypothetical protein